MAQYNSLPDWQKPTHKHLLFSKKQYRKISVVAIIVIPIALYFIYNNTKSFTDEIDQENAKIEELDLKLSTQYEVINALIIQDKIDSALSMIPALVHFSDECREYIEDNECKYTYTDYWKSKREELTKKIEEKKPAN